MFCFAFCFMDSHKSLILVLVRFLDTFFLWLSVGKWTRRHQSGSLTPCSHALFTHVLQTITLHGCVTADITYSMSHVHIEVLACSWATLCSTPVWAPPKKSASRREYCYDDCASQERGCVMLGYAMAAALAAASTRREWMCLQFLWLLESPSSLLARALLTLGSANSEDSEIQWDNWCQKQDEEKYNWRGW